MRGPLKVLLISIVAVVALAALLWWPLEQGRVMAPSTSDGKPGALFLYCAAGIRAPIAEIVARYREEYGVSVQVEYAGSGALLSKIRVAGKGDLYLAADATHIDIARQQGLVDEAIPLAYQRPVIAVAKGNPRQIQSARDLLREDLRTALGSPEAASIGEATKSLLTASGLWDAVSEAARARGVFKPTVNDIANDVKLGAVDAAIVWDSTVKQYPELEAIPLENADKFIQCVTIGVLKCSRQPMAALRLARYVSARDRGLTSFAKLGYPVVDGDAWAETPELLYFSGAVNRLGIEETLKEFQVREGCLIKTVYNGCGVLLGQMKTGSRPDVYHTCDLSFMRGVAELFTPPVKLSQTGIVIATPKGNPLRLRKLEDLSRNGLRLGLANEEQSTLGALTAQLLKEQSLYEGVTRNAVSHTPTADMLVNQLLTGALDAVIVYRANTVRQPDKLDVIPLPYSNAIAVQTYAVGTASEHRQLAGRLLEALQSAQARERYRQAGFEEPVVP